MRIDIITIFPEYFSPLGVSLLGKAVARGTIDLRVHDLRDWADDVHHTVDDAPFGGGPGMVMTPGPWGRALEMVTGNIVAGSAFTGDAVARDAVAGATAAGHPPAARLIVPTPSGTPFT